MPKKKMKNDGYSGGYTQLKNLTIEDIDKMVPIAKDSWDLFLNLMFGGD